MLLSRSVDLVRYADSVWGLHPNIILNKGHFERRFTNSNLNCLFFVLTNISNECLSLMTAWWTAWIRLCLAREIATLNLIKWYWMWNVEIIWGNWLNSLSSSLTNNNQLHFNHDTKIIFHTMVINILFSYKKIS